MIPPDPNGMQNDPGLYEVTHTESNGGGETTLVIRKVMTSRPS